MRKIRSLICLMAVCLLSCFVFPFDAIEASAYVTIAAEIPVSCLAIPDGKTHTYTIVIESENDVSPVPKSDILEITEDGTGKFEINVDEPGTFMYRVYEKPGQEDDIKYDENVYIITVFVENADEDQLKYAVSATVADSSEKPDQIVFENEILGTSDSGTTPEPTEPTSATTSTDSSAASSTGDTTTRTTAVTTTTTDDSTSTDDHLISVLTGDSFPAHAVRAIMLISVLIAIFTFLFKQDNSEEEDKNEE